MAEELKIIGEVKKGGIIISISEFNGNKYLDIRKFFRNEEEKLQPTKKGIALSKEQYKEVLQILADNKEEIDELLS
jgi:hypothetical protein